MLFQRQNLPSLFRPYKERLDIGGIPMDFEEQAKYDDELMRQMCKVNTEGWEKMSHPSVFTFFRDSVNL